MSVTDDIVSFQESKTRARMTIARLVVARAANHCRLYPGAHATLLVRDLKDSLSSLIEEIERR